LNCRLCRRHCQTGCAPGEERTWQVSPPRGSPPPRTVLEALIRQRDRTYEELTAEFDAVARRAGERGTMSPRHLHRLASGERTGTTPVTRRVLQAMFGRPLDELLQPPSPGSGRTTAGPRSPVATRDDPDREREVLRMAAGRAQRFGLIAGETNLGQGSLDRLSDAVHELATAYPQCPLPELLNDLVTAQDTLYTLLEGRQQPNLTRQLYFLAGVVGGLLAKASHDLSDSHAALTQARTAFLCADNADHNGLRAWVRGLQALIAYWAERPLESLRYAQTGAEYAALSGNTTAVWLSVSEARAWAAVGNAAETHAALERGERAWDAVRPDEVDELGGICTFGRARQLYYAADALVWLPSEADEGERYAGQAVDAYADPSRPEWAFGDKAGSHAGLAIARLARGELEGAAEAVRPVLDLPPQQRMNGIVMSLRRVHKALSQSPLAADGRELQERIETFTRTPLRTTTA
jgi:hypothetical protein